ncbi:MAG: hypothetical protein IT260_17520 [Saprospiraceae bacterium]|nr:hypothetical protein [Saprospiraceae bacterium]
MPGKQPFDELFEKLVSQPTARYRSAIGPPVHLSPEAFSEFLARLQEHLNVNPSLALWFVLDYKSLNITHSYGDVAIFGKKLHSLKDFCQRMHPDYLAPYLQWRAAAYEVALRQEMAIDPLEIIYRQSLPMALKDGSYFWFNTDASIIQVDAEGRIATNLQTFYRESRWSPRNQRPFEASVQIKNGIDSKLESQLFAQLSLYLIDEFTNAELDLLSLYATGKSAAEVMAVKGWSRNTLHEYNANLLKKAKALFVYDFRNARDFASYCKEKKFIHLR